MNWLGLNECAKVMIRMPFSFHVDAAKLSFSIAVFRKVYLLLTQRVFEMAAECQGILIS